MLEYRRYACHAILKIRSFHVKSYEKSWPGFSPRISVLNLRQFTFYRLAKPSEAGAVVRKHLRLAFRH